MRESPESVRSKENVVIIKERAKYFHSHCTNETMLFPESKYLRPRVLEFQPEELRTSNLNRLSGTSLHIV